MRESDSNRDHGVCIKSRREKVYVRLQSGSYTTGGCETRDDQCMLIIERDIEGENTGSTWVIVNSDLHAALLVALCDVKGISIFDDPPNVDSNTLFLYRTEILDYANTFATSEQAKHCKMLVDYLDKEYASVKNTLERLMSMGMITFKLSWFLFKPGTTVTWATGGFYNSSSCFIVDYVTKDDEQVDAPACYNIHGRYIGANGAYFGYREITRCVPKFEGAQKITQLTVYPLNLCQDSAKNVVRGERVVSLHGRTHFQYDGLALGLDETKNVLVEGPIVLDEEGYATFRATTGYLLPRPQFDPLVKPLTEEQLTLVTPLLRGFAISEKLWLTFHIDKISEIEWSDPFKSLIIPLKTRTSIEDLISAYTQCKISNIVILISGPPGTGKKSTAKAISKLLHTSLFSTNSDIALGVFKLVSSWNAALLLENADPYVAKCLASDTATNRFRSKVLDLLGKFQGIKILTTDCVVQFDPGMLSRVNLFIDYRQSHPGTRKEQWRHYISKATNGAVEFEDHDLEALSKENLTPREIENVVHVAHSQACIKSAALTISHINDFIKSRKEFNDNRNQQLYL